MSLKERAKKLKVDIPAVFIAMKKKETPVIAKIIAGLTIAYALSPIDLISDFIPILGYLDDLIILPSMVALTIKLIPSEVFATARIITTVSVPRSFEMMRDLCSICFGCAFLR